MKNCHSTRLTCEDYAEVKRLVGIRRAAEFYGYPVDRQGRCLCPFHQDRHPSMKIYPHDGGYYCFACGEGGDVVTFVSRLYGLRNEEAAKKLIEDFSLPIRTGFSSYRERRERAKKIKRMEELSKFQKITSGLLRMYWNLLCEAAQDPASPHFPEAMQELSKVEYRMDCAKHYPEEFYGDRKAVEWLEAVRKRIIGWHGRP